MTLAELIEAERLDFDADVDPNRDRLCECSPTPGVRVSRLLRADRGQRCPDCGGPGEVIPNPWAAAGAELAALIAERDRLRTEVVAERDRLFVELTARTAERDSLRERLAVARVDPARFWPEALRELMKVSRSAARMLEAIDRVELGLSRWLLEQHASTSGGAASGETDHATTTRNP